MALIAIDTSGPAAADVPPAAWLVSAPTLQALRKPAPQLDLVPRHILQQGPPWSWRGLLGRNTLPAAATVVVHIAFAAAFFYLLSFSDVEPPPSHEVEIPVEVVSAVPEPPKPAPTPAPPPVSAPQPAPPKPAAPDVLKQALAMPVAPDPKPPAPPGIQPLVPPAGVPDAPKLVAPPPEPSRAATREREDRPANLAPQTDAVDQATHEAKPAAVPQSLTTADPKAAFAVPSPVEPRPDPVEKPTPDIPAKAPSEADKLAAALPMDIDALPMSFRAILSGNGAAVSAAYKGLVYGRFNRNAAIGERARQQHLKGQVVVAFSIDDAGKIKSLSVLASSGNAAVDALGLDMIRSAAPFPPPPDDAQRSFTPAFSFGE